MKAMSHCRQLSRPFDYSDLGLGGSLLIRGVLGSAMVFCLGLFYDIDTSFKYIDAFLESGRPHVHNTQ